MSKSKLHTAYFTAGLRIRAARREKGWSSEELAERHPMDVSRRTIENIENARHHVAFHAIAGAWLAVGLPWRDLKKVFFT